MDSKQWWNITVPEFLVNPMVWVPHLIKPPKEAMTKISIQTVLLIIIVSGFLVNQILLNRLNTFGSTAANVATPIPVSSKPTSFDLSLDANTRNSFGPLGSGHSHADFKVYLNGEALNFSQPEYFMKSSYIHVDNNQNQEDSSGVLHLHARKVPLWVFFQSLGLKLEKESLTLADGKVLRNENGNNLKFYLNGKKVDELGEYIFQPLDKLLISYGPENDPEIERQIASVTSLAKNHQK